MFGFSLSKILVLAAIIAVVWFGFKWVARVNKLRQSAAKQKVGGGGSAENAEDMVKCPTCDAFVAPESARNCGRNGCPYGG